MCDTFVHFTSLSDAEAIVASGELFCSSYHYQENRVYAVCLDHGAYLPDVQTSGNDAGRVEGPRTHAVIFSTWVTPAFCHEEETVFFFDRLPITDAFVVTADEAIAALPVFVGRDFPIAVPDFV